MSVLPTEVIAGGWYRADNGEDRLVWAVREGRVFYFSRDEEDQHWARPHPPEAAPSVERFAGEVALVNLDGACAEAKSINDTYGSGDW